METILVVDDLQDRRYTARTSSDAGFDRCCAPTMEGFSQKLLQKGHNRKFLSYTQPDTPAAALFIFHVIETG
ncbi:hypothetical protein DSCA_58030 [Desulfosarcina alkanivorans]|uniref:Uncharacterized protein n=1 Tax=Desulfosarcina alkanivorans TaxID=571177 RepID=A0A5K7YV28_9BACT|nr:hypothetical protein DSCA_58030 [Desulfosarcina alkanivorans]